MITVYILACGSFSCCLNHFSAMSVTLNEIPPKVGQDTPQPKQTTASKRELSITDDLFTATEGSSYLGKHET